MRKPAPVDGDQRGLAGADEITAGHALRPGKVTITRGIGPFIHVENLVSQPRGVGAAPREIIIGISIGPSRIR